MRVERVPVNRDSNCVDAKLAGVSSMRILHASPTWFSPQSVGGGERWVDNVMAALSAGAPDIEQAMVAIGLYHTCIRSSARDSAAT